MATTVGLLALAVAVGAWPPGAPETGAGYGLGLALVRQIARAHGGEARCLPREGGGTIFEVTLGA